MKKQVTKSKGPNPNRTMQKVSKAQFDTVVAELRALKTTNKQPRRAKRQQDPLRQILNPVAGQLSLGATVAPKLIRVGMSDIRSHRMSWIAGFIFVGNGTNGATNAVLYQTPNSTFICRGRNGTVSGGVPILSSDTNFGATYITDVEKHFARKIIKRMWLHIQSLNPSTAKSMMAVVGVSRGGGLAENSQFDPLATADGANSLTNVTSMKDSITVASWETKSIEITEFIAGGSGAKQNEFDINAYDSSAGTVLQSGAQIAVDLDGIACACFAVAGNCSDSTLQNTATHQITIEQEVDLIDYVGGMASISPIPEPKPLKSASVSTPGSCPGPCQSCQKI
jgi:hypothetical protein